MVVRLKVIIIIWNKGTHLEVLMFIKRLMANHRNTE